MENTKVKITMLANGALLVEGNITITKKDGSSEVKEGRFSLCGCGYSENKPYCDGSHKNTDF
jgi:CDGSH-type Zn-finger protein|tara:strand:- start:1780 stop:1965 length:186 start_codon:yes stop_codon:yes gene_type:complete